VKSVSKKGFNRFTYRMKISRIVDDYISRVIGDDCTVLANMMFVDKIMSRSRHRAFHVIHSAYSQSLLMGKSAIHRYFIRRNISKVYSHHPLVFVSRGARDSFRANFREQSGAHVIYNPVPVEQIRYLSTADVEVPTGDYIVHVGRFNRAKRHDRLLDAFSKLQSDAKLVLLGDGKLESKVRAQVEELGLGGRVLFSGFVKNPYPLIKRARALVLCSDFEGLPTVVLEAICLGVPIVATDCPGGIREIIDGSSPSLVPLGDVGALAGAMQDALDHPEKYRTSLAEKFQSRIVADQYKLLFSGASTSC
jgi:glycosyltransferase involved in cell wall biosynthesis